ncbi:MAG: hypothetical protein ISN29_01305 [Gammaproteobacteria bacterium AqS3]|nr:hypothetical protein [Gammaproteobacteria bacterium AqS3]
MTQKPERIDAILAQPPGPLDLHGFDDPIAAGLEAARNCEWLDHAFYYGYQVALRQRFARLPSGPLALCHSEKGMTSIKQLSFRALEGVNGWTLHGSKGFITAPQLCTQVLVTAVCGQGADGRLDIGVFLLQLEAIEVSVQIYDQVRIMPRLGQGGIEVKGSFVDAAARIPGDYDSLIRPFGVAETVACAAALSSCVEGLGERLGSGEMQERAGAMRTRLAGLVRGDAADPNTVLACGDIAEEFGQFRAAVLEWVGAHQPDRLADWTRDIQLFGFIGPLWDRRIARARADLEAAA